MILQISKLFIYNCDDNLISGNLYFLARPIVTCYPYIQEPTIHNYENAYTPVSSPLKRALEVDSVYLGCCSAICILDKGSLCLLFADLVLAFNNDICFLICHIFVFYEIWALDFPNFICFDVFYDGVTYVLNFFNCFCIANSTITPNHMFQLLLYFEACT